MTVCVTNHDRVRHLVNTPNSNAQAILSSLGVPTRLFLLAAALAIAIPALAHATVRTEMGLSESKVGANETYRLRVPSEKEMDTIELRLVVPVGLTVSNFEALPAWQRSVTKNAQGIVTEVTWEGGKIGESEYALFPFRAKNPTTPGTLLFKVYQKYSDGSIVAWDKEDKTADTPASQVEIK